MTNLKSTTAISKKILIGEDSSVVQNLTRMVLENEEYAILTAKNGVAVLDKLNQEAIALILLDISMPVMDGLSCAQKVRARVDDKAGVPMFAITGNAKNLSLEEYKAAGFDEVLQKPLDYDLLVELVRRYTIDS